MIARDERLRWKFTRHFFASKTTEGHWIIEGELPVTTHSQGPASWVLTDSLISFSIGTCLFGATVDALLQIGCSCVQELRCISIQQLIIYLFVKNKISSWLVVSTLNTAEEEEQ